MPKINMLSKFKIFLMIVLFLALQFQQTIAYPSRGVSLAFLAGSAGISFGLYYLFSLRTVQVVQNPERVRIEYEAEKILQKIDSLKRMLTGEMIILSSDLQESFDALPDDMSRDQKTRVILEGLSEKSPADYASPSRFPYTDYPLFTIDIKNWRQYLNEQQSFRIPEAFSALHALFIQPIVNLQIHNSCGLHAICNAKAVQELFEQKKPITSDSLQKKEQEIMQRYAPLILFRDRDAQVHRDFRVMLEDYEVKDIAQQMGLVHVYYLGMHDNKIALSQPPVVRTLQEGEFEQMVAQQKISQQSFQNSGREKIVHYVCNINPEHWVLLSFVRTKPGLAPTIYYLDSKNVPLLDGTVIRENRMRVLYYAQQLIELW